MTRNDQEAGSATLVGTKALGASMPSAQARVLLSPLSKKDYERASKFLINVSVALEALWANRLRSLLTTLGILIGISSVVGMVTLIDGVSASWLNTIASLGTNMIIIAPGTGNNSRGSASSRGPSILPSTQTTLSLTPDDAQAVTKIPDVIEVSPTLSIQTRVITGNRNWNTRVTGVDPSLMDIQNWTIAQGSWFSTTDNQGARSVAVLGQTVYQQLFADSGQNPIGQTVQIGNQLFRVIGVLDTKGGAASSDDVVFVPFSTALARLKSTNYVDQILLKVDDSSNLDTVQRNVTTLLEQRHHITGSNPDDFNITNSQQLLQTFNQTITLVTALYVSITSISLVVGGIGVMNIMIVSVTERTREIGIRMSLGAQRSDIRNQFLIEAVALSMVGGLIGIVLGELLGFELTSRLGVPFVIKPLSLLLPFAVSAGIGVIFGIYPAMRAARLDPIEALRSL